MIWATVSSWPFFFCWLYRAAPSLAAMSIINLTSVLTIQWRPRVELSLRGCLLWPVHSLGKTLLDSTWLHYVLQGLTCLLFQEFLDFLLSYFSPLWWKEHLFFWCWGFSCGSASEEYSCNVVDLGSVPELERFPGEGKWFLLQYSGLENSLNGAVHGITKSQTWLSNFHFTFSC